MLKDLRIAKKRKERVRSSLKKRSGGRLRLSVFKSNRYIYAQIIDDAAGITIVSASTHDKVIKGAAMRPNIESAAVVGKMIAERALKHDISTVVFDRGSCIYHGRVKALADAARQNGLKF